MIFRRICGRVAGVALVALLTSMSWSASATRAASDADIPGIPLPGTVVTGTLGGPAYDRVYSIDVAAHSIILLSLSGDAGTDFDLYLFDSSATSVYSTQGQVASSTSSTSTESITHLTQGGGRFYIDLSGFSEQAGGFRLVVSIGADTTPPNVVLTINGGAPAAPDSTVRVTVVATDDLSGVDVMQFSVDGSDWDDWRPYVPTTLWSFPAIDGPRQLWVRVRDQSGNVSAAATATIVIDTVSPQVIDRFPAPNEPVASLRPVLSLNFSEPIDAATWLNLGLLVQGPDGSTLAGEYAYDLATLRGTFTPSEDMVPGEAYVVTVGSVMDLAGNPVAPIGSWTIRPVRSHVATVAVSPRSVVYGTVVAVVGHVDVPVASSLSVERSVAGGTWQVLGAVVSSAAGDFEVRTTATANTRYRLHIAGGTTEAEQFSSTASLTVRRRVSLAGVSSATTRRVASGTTVALRAVLAPAAPDVVVTMTVYRYDTVRRVYTARRTLRQTSVHGVAGFTWQPTVRGSYYVRLTTPGTVQLGGGVSASYRWVIP